MNRIILDMPPEEYHAHPAISKSGLDKLHRSPLHYRYYREHPQEDTKALAFGRAFHAMVLEPEKFTQYVGIAPAVDRRTKAGKEEYEIFLAEAAGKAIINQEDHATAKEMARAILTHPAARIVLGDKGKAEASLFWQEGEVECRCRPDWLREDGLLIDLKTCADASPEGFRRSAFNYRYHVQAAMYAEGYKAVTGKESAEFAFVCVEKEPPYAVAVYHATPEFLELGFREYAADLATYINCVLHDKWPGYSETSEPLGLPAWISKQLEQGTYA